MVRILWIFCIAALFIASPGLSAREELTEIGLIQEATASCEDFGLFSVYQGAEYTDAFSSVAYLGQGIVMAGKRSWNESPPNIAIYRSTDYGLHWNAVPNPSGITGRHVYFFGQHDSRVFAGTGDEGNVCLMRSDDYGATWSVVLTTADMRTLAGTSNDTGVAAVYTPVYMGNNRWLVNLGNLQTDVYLLESLDDGDNWHAFKPPGIDTSARKMILTSDGTLLYAGFLQNPGMYVSHDRGHSFSKTSSFRAFAGMADLGNGSYLAGTYNGVYCTNPNYAPPIDISIYKSSDYGQTWTLKKTVSLPTGLGYFRTMIKVAEDLVIAYASCSECSQSDRCAEAYASRDGGETWTIDPVPAFVGPNGNMNAIYDTVLVKPGTFIATAQPDSNILRSNNPVAICQDVTVPADGSCQGAASVDNGSYDPKGGALNYAQTPAGPYSLGTALVTLVVTDSGGCTDSCTAQVTVQDVTGPTIICPGNITANATSALGAAVSFPLATASDNCAASATCTPASGSIFAIGTSQVTCTATDTSGNIATCTFSVKVKSAAEQTADLIAMVQGLAAPKLDPGVRNALLVKLQLALASINTENKAIACRALQDFINLSKAQMGKKIIPKLRAMLLIDDATRIRAVLGCP